MQKNKIEKTQAKGTQKKVEHRHTPQMMQQLPQVAAPWALSFPMAKAKSETQLITKCTLSRC